MMIIHQVLHARYYCCTLCMFHLYYFAHTSNADRQVITLCANEHLSAPPLFIAGMKCACQSRSLVCVSFLIVLSQLLNFACSSYSGLSGALLHNVPRALSKSFVFITLIDKQPSKSQEAELEIPKSIFCQSPDHGRCVVMNDLRKQRLAETLGPWCATSRSW